MTLEQEPDPLRRIPIVHTADLHAEIGAVLRAARLKHGQSLEVVAQQTRISKRFLDALENDRFEEFPAVVYLRGFLQGYCEHLEVDFDEIWTKLERAKAKIERPQDELVAPAAGRSPTNCASGIASPHGSLTPPSKAVEAQAQGAYARGGGATGAIVLAVALAFGLGLWLFKEQSRGPAAALSAAPAALLPLPRSVEPKLVIHLKNDAWLRVSLDGQIVFEGRAPRGSAQEWKPLKFLALRTTAPAALELNLNGAPIALGAPTPDGEYRVEIP